jgi:hypothetical protein
MNKSKKEQAYNTGMLVLGVAVICSAVVAVSGLAFENNNVTLDLKACQAEATAWYEANSAQADANTDWNLAGRPATGPDYTLSQKYVAEANAIHCIEPTPQPDSTPYPRG